MFDFGRFIGPPANVAGQARGVGFPPQGTGNFLEEQGGGGWGVPMDEDWNGGRRRAGNIPQGLNSSSQAAAFSGPHSLGGYGAYPGGQQLVPGFPAPKPPTFPPPQPPAGMIGGSSFQSDDFASFDAMHRVDDLPALGGSGWQDSAGSSAQKAVPFNLAQAGAFSRAGPPPRGPLVGNRPPPPSQAPQVLPVRPPAPQGPPTLAPPSRFPLANPAPPASQRRCAAATASSSADLSTIAQWSEENRRKEESLYLTTPEAERAAREKYGLMGILKVIRMTDPDLNTLALGMDLTTLGLNLNSNECLYSTFASPWCDTPARKDPEFYLPNCYYMSPPRLKTEHLQKFSLETLSYIFFNMPRDILQAYAAAELYNRGWKYHQELKAWLILQEEEGKSRWVCFDGNTWEKRYFLQPVDQSGFLSEDDVRVPSTGGGIPSKPMA